MENANAQKVSQILGPYDWVSESHVSEELNIIPFHVTFSSEQFSKTFI
jgi:hypothetical protein